MFHWFKRWTKTEHEFCQEMLSAFLDGQLKRRERLRVQKHLERCAACRRDLASLQQMVALLRATPMIKPPRAFFIPASEKVKQRQWQRARLAYGYLRVATAMATVLFVLVVSSDALLRFVPMAPTRPLPAAAPASAVRTFEAEQTPVELAGVPPTAPAARLPSVEMPTIMPLTVEGAVPQPLPEPTGLALLAPPVTSEAAPQEVAGVTQDSQEQAPQMVPSQTFARSAGVPVPPTASPEAEATASPSVEQKQPVVSTLETEILPEVTSVPTDTLVLTTSVSESIGTAAQPEPTGAPLMAPALPEPTGTPVLPTATPEPTSTPVPPTATPVPTRTPVPPTATPLLMQTPMPTVETPAPQPIPREWKAAEETEFAPSGLWTILHATHAALPWLEWALGISVALLLAITLWVRQAQRSL